MTPSPDNTYTATASRDGEWWSIEVEGLRGAYTQARRLDQVEEMARDIVALLLDVAPDTIAIEVHIDLDSVIRDRLDRLAELRRQADQLQETAAEESRSVVLGLQGKGLPLRDIGTLLGVSHQRAGQLAKSAKRRATPR